MTRATLTEKPVCVRWTSRGSRIVRSAVVGLAITGAITAGSSDRPEPEIRVPVVVEPDADGSTESALAIAENDVFTVVGANLNDVRAVERISAGLRGLGSGWLPMERKPQQLIAVQLIERNHRPGDAHYDVRIDRRGGILVSLRWNEDLPLEQVCEALARAYLAKVLWQYNPDLDPAMIPDWLVFSLGASLEVAWIPGRREALAQRAKLHQPMALVDLLPMTGSDDERRDRVVTESYWLLRFLRAEWRRLPPSLWLSLLAGAEPDWAVIAAHSATPADERGRELWWAVGRADLILSRSGPVLSLAESRDVVYRLGYVTIEDETGDRRMPANAIADLDQAEPYLSIAANQARFSKMLLVRINPVYQGALVSLGGFYESLADGDFDAAATHFDRFIEDFAVATQMHSDIDRLIAR